MGQISLKRIKLSGAPNTGVQQSHSHGMMQNLSINDWMQQKLRRDMQVLKDDFSNGDGNKLCYLMT